MLTPGDVGEYTHLFDFSFDLTAVFDYELKVLAEGGEVGSYTTGVSNETIRLSRPCTRRGLTTFTFSLSRGATGSDDYTIDFEGMYPDGTECNTGGGNTVWIVLGIIAACVVCCALLPLLIVCYCICS